MLSSIFLKANMTSKQCLKIKSFIVNTNNHLNGVFPSFDSLNKEFSPRFRLIDIFSSWLSFHWANCKDKESRAAHIYKLNEVILHVSLSANTVIVVSDVSIRNNIATFIAHIHSYSNPIKKTPWPKPSYSLSDGGLTKQSKSWMLLESSLSLILSIWHIISSILPFIPINNNILPYWRILGCFSINILPISSNFGIARAMLNGPSMCQLIKTQRDSILFLYLHLNHHGTSRRKKNVTTS